ncbi:DUF565 domain-containing protein [Calothrix sp. UHCC 0171]|uniref:DUF565 domain-containing protein n=1 Tax=Calothrix sp. UHCC 0171 TaxID=3110245 RepID=UPI002B209131|nr:DUF565 domain-containing protein [Calothrix sp. UHCC 0171]MEA5571531.1 DUF565 domain-containing protein [Calothrix sp. UHCC 0171]
MQNTRLNDLFDAIAQRLGQWLSNPWRRWSVLIISFLLGIFLGTAISTTAGQQARLDIVIAAILVLITEFTSQIYYRRRFAVGSLWLESLNILKIGFVYSLFIEAFKLGS